MKANRYINKSPKRKRSSRIPTLTQGKYYCCSRGKFIRSHNTITGQTYRYRGGNTQRQEGKQEGEYCIYFCFVLFHVQLILSLVYIVPVENSFTSFSRLIGDASKVRYFPVRHQVSFASFFSWRSLAASSASFVPAAMNLHHPSVVVSTHTRASNVIPSKPPRYANAWMPLSTQPIHYLSFPPRPLHTPPSRFSNTICFGNSAYKSLIVRKAFLMLSHLVISMAWLQEVIRRSSLLRCAPMMQSKTQ